MTAKSKVVALEHVVIRFSGDSGDASSVFRATRAMVCNLPEIYFRIQQHLPETISPPSRTIRLKSAHRKAPWLASLASKCTLDTNPFTPLATSAMSSWP